MLDEQGYIRLTDFGLSKNKFDEREKLETICGTPEYLAPEVLGRTGYGKEVDIWAIGALIFEMLTSLPPFYSSKREELFKMIVYDPVKLPKHLSPECKSLLAGLFQKDPTKRITIKDVKLHPWFAEIDWDGLLQKKFKAPFRPKLNGELDLNNFPQEFTEMAIDSMRDSLSMKYFTLENFSWDNQKAASTKTLDQMKLEKERNQSVLVQPV
eukprot:TRINITY_DN2575_c0_g1_i1.p1 TRINITY_DN2575_c0_g1~~TRINITY_DN2575_c0_g1_i1.p1  ORF type:complete len:211 (-),score=58.23 TRINITY_DN2575_c0_g1_i1:136-768(-)